MSVKDEPVAAAKHTDADGCDSTIIRLPALTANQIPTQ